MPGLEGLKMKSAVGVAPAPIATDLVTWLERPLLFVTVNFA
jgi:hypothetical protein